MAEANFELENTNLADVQDYLKENADCIFSKDRPFSNYMKGIFKKKNVKQKEVFLWADVPERYGYKLISGEKRTRQRDVILRICYAARFTLEETQMALRIYELPPLYEKLPRDLVLMLCFRDRPGSVNDVNVVLRKHGMDALRSSGVQE